jgi:hypothetical protein
MRVRLIHWLVQFIGLIAVLISAEWLYTLKGNCVSRIAVSCSGVTQGRI